VISVVNHKGGVGKTTTTINLGKALSLLNQKVLLVDMDPQGNLSQCFGINDPEKQVVDSLLNGKEPLAIYNIAENLDIAPSDIALARADMELVQAVGGIQSLSRPLNSALPQYDYVLIDCPPSLNIFTNCALTASTSCLVTLQPEVSSIKGMNDLFGRIAEIQERVNYNLSVEGILLTLVDNRLKVHRDCIDYIKEEMKEFNLFDAQIRNNTKLKESQLAQEDIFEYDENCSGAIDYMNLAKELI
jgi:chromosome partitioning protein